MSVHLAGWPSTAAARLEAPRQVNGGRSALPRLQVALIRAETQGVKTPDGALASIARAIASGADVVVAPEWFFVSGRDPAAFSSIMRDMQRITRGSRALVIPGSVAMCDAKGQYRNVVMAFCDGRALYAYSKRRSGGDQWVGLGLGATAWKPGERSSFFEWRGLRVGIEICADHQQGMAHGDLDRDGGPAPDLQIVVASGARVEPTAVVVREGGAVLCADGSPGSPRIEAYRAGSGSLSPRPVQRRERCGATTIHHLSL